MPGLPDSLASQEEMKNFRQNIQLLTFGRQSEISRHLRISRQTIIAMALHSNPRLSVVIAITRYLGVSIDSLLNQPVALMQPLPQAQPQQQRSPQPQRPQPIASVAEAEPQVPLAKRSAVVRVSKSSRVIRKTATATLPDPAAVKSKSRISAKVALGLRMVARGISVREAARRCLTSAAALNYHLRRQAQRSAEAPKE